MKTVISSVLAGLVLLPMPAHAELTGNEFLKAYDASKQENRRLLEVAIGQIENGLGWANSYLAVVRKQRPLYCTPGRLALTNGQIVDILRRETKEDRSIGEQPLGFAIILANQKAFPCPPNSN